MGFEVWILLGAIGAAPAQPNSVPARGAQDPSGGDMAVRQDAHGGATLVRDNIAKGDDLLRRGKTDEAEKLYATACGLDPKNTAAWERLVQARMAGTKWAQALEAAERWQDLTPTDPQVHLRMGIALFELAEPERAAKTLARAIELDGKDGAPHLYLGRIAAESGDLERAQAELETAVRLSADRVLAHYHLGLLLLKQGKFEPARAAFAKAVELSPDFASAHMNLGLALKRLGRDDEAKIHFQRFRALTDVVSLDTQKRARVTSRLNASRLELEAGRLDAALKFALEALEVGPDIAAVHAQLAVVYERQGKKDESARERAEFERLSGKR